MTGFVKIQSSILQSTIWREENHIRILWITMLTLSDKEGVVEGSIPGLADIAHISISECEHGLARLMAPDPYSRTKDFEGKRIGEIDGGWIILNYEKYREPTSKQRTADWRKRNKEKEDLQHDCANVTSQSVTERHSCHTASPSASASVSVSSFSLSSDPIPNNKTKVVKDKDRVNVKELTSKYLDIFNAVFNRRTLSQSILEPRVRARIDDGVPPWQILSVCIAAKALDANIDRLQGFDASLLLRDGKHARTTAYGTCGATNWIEKTFLKIDTAHLDERLTRIAEKYGVLDELKDKVKTYWSGNED